MSSRHGAPRELSSRTRRPVNVARTVVQAGVFAVAVGFGAVAALPAYAMTPTGTNPVASTVNAGGTFVPLGDTAPTQTLSVETGLAPLASARDSYSATDPAVLQAAADAAVQAQTAAALAAVQATTFSTATANDAFSASNSGGVSFAPPATAYSGAAVVAYAEQFVGVVPYGWGASPDDSFGCDGLTQYVFGQFGISLPRGVDHQAALGTQISESDAQAGDLVVWPGEHIAIYDGNGGVIHSPDWGRYVEHAHQLWGNPIFVRL
jgi:cell wall-associated NlpC family hydrolase